MCKKNKSVVLLLRAAEKIELREDQRAYFVCRYIDIVQRLNDKYAFKHCFFTVLRCNILIGSVFISACLSLERSSSLYVSEFIFWLVFALSLCVTVSSGVLELFKFAALDTKYLISINQLETEGWQFLALSNKYAEYHSCSQAFVKFCGRVEKLHNQLIHDLSHLKQSDKKNDNGSVEKNFEREDVSLTASLTASSNVQPSLTHNSTHNSGDILTSISKLRSQFSNVMEVGSVVDSGVFGDEIEKKL
jgi:hypothetical protein